MPEPLSERLHAALAQRLFDEEQRRAGLEPFPLSLTTLHGDLYALASALMDAISPLIAEAAAYDWPTAAPCPPLSFTGGACANKDPHTAPEGCYGATTYVPDAHDRSEAIQ